MSERSSPPKRPVSLKRPVTDFENRNPCFKEHQLSLSCLDTNNYDRSKCQDHFENYKNCKLFWYTVCNDRRRKGITPYLPVPKDRDEVKNEYLDKIKGWHRMSQQLPH